MDPNIIETIKALTSDQERPYSEEKDPRQAITEAKKSGKKVFVSGGYEVTFLVYDDGDSQLANVYYEKWAMPDGKIVKEYPTTRTRIKKRR
ncbi:MAG: hypothetical protein QXL89_09425 [Nitrososphaeria archaeon]